MESNQFQMEENRFRCWEPNFSPLRCPQDISQKAAKDCLPGARGLPNYPGVLAASDTLSAPETVQAERQQVGSEPQWPLAGKSRWVAVLRKLPGEPVVLSEGPGKSWEEITRSLLLSTGEKKGG